MSIMFLFHIGAIGGRIPPGGPNCARISADEKIQVASKANLISTNFHQYIDQVDKLDHEYPGIVE